MYRLIILLPLVLFSCSNDSEDQAYFTISKDQLLDKIKGAWAVQTIGVTYGGPTEFKFKKRIIPDSIEIEWYDSMMYRFMTERPGLYDDVYMDLTFVEVLEKEGLGAPASSFGKAYAEASYWLWHANQQGRYNILNGLQPPQSGHWLQNPHADDIDFQIEADFAGIMSPGMPNIAAEICDRVGHVMNSGDGYYGGVFVAAMYSNAFVTNDIDTIVNRGLAMIPRESTFHQCILDVIQWHQQYPDDWQQTWLNLEEKWGEDIGCPDGVHQDFNIDSKLNSAYVVIGLLYGNGELGRTMEIATRCGQDSDCNPATAGAILGTVNGYKKIPEYWSKGLALIEDMDFKYTQISLSEVYEISFRHALEMIKKGGGSIDSDEIRIKLQEIEPVPLEQNFPNYHLAKREKINQRFVLQSEQEFSHDFEGVGVVLTGKAGNLDHEKTYGLISSAENLNDSKLEVEFYIDGRLTKTNQLPLNFITRAHELFFQYELPPGPHTLRMKILNPQEKIYLDLHDLIT